MGLLPTDPQERKGIPITTGVFDYFPRALAEVAKVSLAGNNQHNPGQPLHWSKEKSYDHGNTIGRHLLERGTIDTDQQRHSAKLAWRALANLEIEIMAEQGDEIAIKQVMEIGTEQQKAYLQQVLAAKQQNKSA